jgi:hypothetical protein
MLGLAMCINVIKLYVCYKILIKHVA